MSVGHLVVIKGLQHNTRTVCRVNNIKIHHTFPQNTPGIEGHQGDSNWHIQIGVGHYSDKPTDSTVTVGPICPTDAIIVSSALSPIQKMFPILYTRGRCEL